MHSKHIVSILALVMVTNSAAVASPASQGHSFKVDESLIRKSVDEQSAEMKQTSDQIQALIICLEAFRDANQKNSESVPLDTLKMVISALGVTSGAAALRSSTPKTPVELAMAATSGVLSATLEYFVGGNTIKLEEVEKVMQRTHKDIADRISTQPAGKERKLMAGILSQIGKINEQISPSSSEVQKQIGSGQTGLAITSVLSLTVKYSAFFLSKKFKTVLATKAPNLISNSQKGAEMTQKGGLWGLGITNLFPLASAAVGMSGEPAERQINKIISKLIEVKGNLDAANSSDYQD